MPAGLQEEGQSLAENLELCSNTMRERTEGHFIFLFQKFQEKKHKEIKKKQRKKKAKETKQLGCVKV